MAWLNKFQEGGAVAPQQVAQPSEEELMQQLAALVQAAMGGDQQATQQIQQIMQAAQQGDQQAQQIAGLIQQIAQELQGGSQMAKNGAKLEYIHTLRCGGKTKKKACGGSAVKKEACGGSNVKKGMEGEVAVKEEQPVKKIISRYRKEYAQFPEAKKEVPANVETSPAKKEDEKTAKAKCGAKVKKAAKGNCNCKKLYRVGGKLVTVDCEGNIIK